MPSEFVRASVLARFDVPPDHVHVVPHGVEPSRVAPTPEDVLRRRYQLTGPVVLYPAITYPHKNHRVLIEAFASVLRDHPEAILVLTGGEGAEEAALAALGARLGVAHRVRRTGRIPVADLVGLYRTATVVAVPSRYEGFGLPAAEAMAEGASVVAAAATALPEVVGDAALLVDPDDVPGWATAIGALLGDPARRAELAERARRQVQGLTWDANAAGLVRLYRAALDTA